MQDLITPDWMVAQGFSETLAERFWEKVEITDGCWIWRGALNTAGYGIIFWKKAPGERRPIYVRSNRCSWMLHFGPIKEGFCICHNCPGGDNRRCVRPDHLWLGTKSENSLDMNLKGARARGVHCNRSTIQEDDVRAILRLASEGILTYEAIAKLYGVSGVTVGRIAARTSWKHIN